MRKCILALLVLWGALSMSAFQRLGPGSYTSSSVARNQAEEKILTVLQAMAKSGETYLSVPEADGKALRLVTEAVDAQSVVEIGTSTGYSGLWSRFAEHGRSLNDLRNRSWPGRGRS